MSSSAEATIAVTNPATGEEIARVPDGTAADVDPLLVFVFIRNHSLPESLLQDDEKSGVFDHFGE